MLGLSDYEQKLSSEQLQVYNENIEKIWLEESGNIIGYQGLSGLNYYLQRHSDLEIVLSGNVRNRINQVVSDMEERGYSRRIENENERVYKEVYNKQTKRLTDWEDRLRIIRVGTEVQAGIYEYKVTKDFIENRIYLSPYMVVNLTSGRIYYNGLGLEVEELFKEVKGRDNYSGLLADKARLLGINRLTIEKATNELSALELRRVERLLTIASRESGELKRLGIVYKATEQGVEFSYGNHRLEILPDGVREYKGEEQVGGVSKGSTGTLLDVYDKWVQLTRQSSTKKRDKVLRMVRESYHLNKGRI